MVAQDKQESSRGMLDAIIPTLTALSDGVVAPDSCGGVVANGVDNCGGVVAMGVSLSGVHDSCGGIVAPDLFRGGPEHSVSLADWYVDSGPPMIAAHCACAPAVDAVCVWCGCWSPRWSLPVDTRLIQADTRLIPVDTGLIQADTG